MPQDEHARHGDIGIKLMITTWTRRPGGDREGSPDQGHTTWTTPLTLAAGRRLRSYAVSVGKAQ